jgi:hypothetical protein
MSKHAGLRFDDLGNTSGDNGLRLGILPELKIDGESSFGCVPTLVRICAGIHRGRFRYATYVPAEACETVQNYLN